jgi:hypothetical protein
VVAKLFQALQHVVEEAALPLVVHRRRPRLPVRFMVQQHIGNVTIQVLRLGREGLPLKTRSKAASAEIPCLRIVEM